MATPRKSAIEYYPPDLLSRWPRGSGRAPKNNELEQACALLFELSSTKRPKGSSEALAVASYLNGSWNPAELGEAIKQATGAAKKNDWLNIIKQPSPEGMRDLGLYDLHEQGGRGNRKLSITLRPKGKKVVADYYAREGIQIPEEQDQEADAAAASVDKEQDQASPLDPTDPGDDLPSRDQVESMQTSMEGERWLTEHLARERDPALVRQFKNQLSSFACSICNFDFENVYGAIGRGFIEAHHLEQIGLREGSTPTCVLDLIAVCSNCHTMIHQRATPYTADEIRRFLKRR